MKVILRSDIDTLGRLGEIVKVKPGYARNYLLPKGLAMLVSDGNLKVFEAEKKKLQKKVDEVRFKAQELATKVEACQVTIPVRVGEGDKLFGSVTVGNIADAMLAQGVEVERKRILLDEPIRALGEYTVRVRLHPDVRSELKVTVVRHEVESGSEEN